MAKPPAPAGPKQDRASSGNILTGGVAGGGAVGPLPPAPRLAAPVTSPAAPKLTERLAQVRPSRGLARRIPVAPPAPSGSGALAGLLGVQGRRPDDVLQSKFVPTAAPLASRSPGIGGASQESSDVGRNDPLSPKATPRRSQQQMAESPIPLVEEKTAREKKVERERKRLEKSKDPKMVVRMEENRNWAIQNNRQV
ncbi:MAG: hypothetical protein MJE12_06980, partial [Alphaproteobacteria bacterium]|nr:hypothetical protein [Alphaproteobacteria bacterium]